MNAFSGTTLPVPLSSKDLLTYGRSEDHHRKIFTKIFDHMLC